MVVFPATRSWYGKQYSFYRSCPTRGEAVRVAGDLRKSGNWNARTSWIRQKNGKIKWGVYRREK